MALSLREIRTTTVRMVARPPDCATPRVFIRLLAAAKTGISSNAELRGRAHSHFCSDSHTRGRLSGSPFTGARDMRQASWATSRNLPQEPADMPRPAELRFSVLGWA